jgi:type I restriction enzyme M protein
MRDTKQALKDSIRKQEKFEAYLAEIERDKKKALDALGERPEFADLTGVERKKNAAYVDAVKAISDEYSSQLDALRLRLAEIYEKRRREGLPDYDIFMAIAEDIGYDATGRDTKTNELVQISEELNRFIKTIDEGKA